VSAHLLALTVLLAPSQTPGESGVVSGIAMNGTTETPIPGARNRVAGQPRRSICYVAETTTDAEEQFAFEGLPVEKGRSIWPALIARACIILARACGSSRPA
jgi:hypothetical protein